jgi:hypothetical protein
VFVDFWNFQLGWNTVTSRAACDWRAVPTVLVQEAANVVGLKVVNAAWKARGHELRTASWGSFDIDGLVAQLKR